jgi:hypothetical protein
VRLRDGVTTSVERCPLLSAEFPVALLQSQNRTTERRLKRPRGEWDGVIAGAVKICRESSSLPTLRWSERDSNSGSHRGEGQRFRPPHTALRTLSYAKCMDCLRLRDLEFESGSLQQRVTSELVLWRCPPDCATSSLSASRRRPIISSGVEPYIICRFNLTDFRISNTRLYRARCPPP